MSVELDAAIDRFGRGFTPRLTDVEQAELLRRLSAAETDLAKQEGITLARVKALRAAEAHSIGLQARLNVAEARVEAIERQTVEGLKRLGWKSLNRLSVDELLAALARAALSAGPPETDIQP